MDDNTLKEFLLLLRKLLLPLIFWIEEKYGLKSHKIEKE
jgi:hypothetical protein